MIVSCKRPHNLFDLTNLWKNNVIDYMLEDHPSIEVHPELPVQVDKKLEDLSNQQAFDDLFNPWPEPSKQETEPAMTYELYQCQFRKSISPERQIEAQVWNHIHGRADLPPSHGQ